MSEGFMIYTYIMIPSPVELRKDTSNPPRKTNIFIIDFLGTPCSRKEQVVTRCKKIFQDAAKKCRSRCHKMLQDMARCFKKVVQIKSRFEKPWSGTSKEYPLQRGQRSSADQKHIIKTTAGEIENATDLTEGGQGSANW